jgi:hypothetical protein
MLLLFLYKFIHITLDIVLRLYDRSVADNTESQEGLSAQPTRPLYFSILYISSFKIIFIYTQRKYLVEFNTIGWGQVVITTGFSPRGDGLLVWVDNNVVHEHLRLFFYRHILYIMSKIIKDTPNFCLERGRTFERII